MTENKVVLQKTKPTSHSAVLKKSVLTLTDSCSQRDIKLENTSLLTTSKSSELPDISMFFMQHSFFKETTFLSSLPTVLLKELIYTKILLILKPRALLETKLSLINCLKIVIREPISLTIDSTKAESLVKSDSKEDSWDSTKGSPITTGEETKDNKGENPEKTKKAEALA
ncbi:hypothetical protein G9A89_015961 [Geosiphon pyriformis]|nr:hypothetical protein G9A89_015961 [Geosiphon pyriformis]